MERYEDKNTGVQAEVSDKTLSFEINGEISLPDYLGEVSRLLWVRPTVLPPARFLNGGNAEFSGRVYYQALYAAPDGELYSASGEDAYAFSVPTEADHAAMLSVQVTPDVVVGRVAAPRKLTVRCRLHAHVCGYAEKNIGVVLPEETADRVCCLGDVQESGRFCAGVGETVDLYDELDVSEQGGVRIVSARGEVFLPDATATTDAVHCRGEVIVTLLCCKADASGGEEVGAEGTCPMPYTLVRRLPLECEVPLGGVNADHEARAAAVVSEVRAIAEEGKVTVAVRVVPQAEATCKQLACYTKDLFMPDMYAECRHSEERVWQPQCAINKHFSISGNASPMEIGMPATATVIDACAEAEVREKSTDGKNIVLAGDVHCHVLYRHGNEYGAAEAAIPFRVVTEGSFEALSVQATVPVCRVQRDGERVRTDAELLLALRASAFAGVAPVSEVKLLPRETERSADLELCYPAAEETLWNIAKRYAVSPEKIAVANGISEDAMADAASLSGVRYLLIP